MLARQFSIRLSTLGAGARIGALIQPATRRSRFLSATSADMSAPRSSAQAAPQAQPQPASTDANTTTGPDATPAPLLPLPASADAAPAGGSPSEIDMSTGGGSLRLDHLGPLVVNVDGTMSRIGNWAEMADVERENTLRILGRRNKARLETLRAKKAAAGEGQ